MNFDFLSFVLGAIATGAVARALLWSENLSLAHRIAHNLLQAAQESIAGRYRIMQAENPDIDFSKVKVLPIETEQFLIQEVPSLTTQTDVDIQSFTSVYSKQYGSWFLINESYNCENVSSRYFYYLSNKNFEKLDIIKIPYEFNLAKHLK
jgi:hypothetical protein